MSMAGVGVVTRQASRGDESEPLLHTAPHTRYVPKRYYTGPEDLNTITETDEEPSFSTSRIRTTSWRYEPRAGQDTWHQRVGLSPGAAVILASLLTALSLGAATLALPLYLAAMEKAGGDPYTAMLLAGVWPPAVYAVVVAAARLVAPRRAPLGMPRTPVVYVLGVGLVLGVGVVLLSHAAPPWRTHSLLQPVLLTCVLPVSALLVKVLKVRGKYVSQHRSTHEFDLGVNETKIFR